MIDTVVQFCIVVCLVLPVNFLHFRGKFEYFFVDHEVLNRVMKVKILINMCSGRIEGRQNY